MNAAEFLTLYKAGKRNFKWVDLRHADLNGIDLTGVNFSGANLSTANLYKVNLSDANLTGANLKGANLRGAQLGDVTWDGAKLKGARFSPGVIQSLPDGILNGPNSQGLESAPLPNPETDEEQPPGLSQYAPVPLPEPLPEDPHSATYPQLTLQQWSQLPRPPLALLSVGYLCLGILLGLHQTGLGAWLLVWISALVIALDETFVWFLPVAGAIATLVGTGLPLLALLFAAAIFLLLLISLKFLGWPWRKALFDSVWVAGIATLLISSANWLFIGYGRTIIVSGRFPMALLLFFGIGGLGLGSIGWIEMETLGFSKQTRIQVFALSAALSLFIGFGLGYILAL